MAFGDSITLAARQDIADRWVTIASKRLNKFSKNIKVEMINSGVGSETSRDGLRRIDEDVIAHKPDIVLVEFGGNDTTDDPEREVLIDEFGANIKAIYDKITDAGAKMVLLPFTPIVDEWHLFDGKEKYVQYGGPDKCAEPYRRFVREFAAEKGLGLIDVDIALREAAEETTIEKIFLPDGVHLTAEGNKVIADLVIEKISSEILNSQN